MSLGYVRWGPSRDLTTPNMRRAEQGIEFNTLLSILPMMYL
jgi:hypothetical protein